MNLHAILTKRNRERGPLRVGRDATVTFRREMEALFIKEWADLTGD